MKRVLTFRQLILLGSLLMIIGYRPVLAETITMSTTTSTQASGLLDVLLPALEKDTGITVKVIAKGTGAAIRDGIDGNVDVIFVHDRAREEEFVKEGWGTKRFAVMHNDFVIVGPPADPAGIKGISDAAIALSKIAAARQLFISRGDDSGTHAKEQDLWKLSKVALEEIKNKVVTGGKETITTLLRPKAAEWYVSIGQGMGKVLTYADEKRGYALTDRGTYINYKYGREVAIDLEILSEGGAALGNPYGVIPVNPAKHPHVKYELARQFAEWLVSKRGQEVIGGYQVLGKQLFFPDAL